MNFSLDQILIIIGILLLSSVFASKISHKIGVPALLLFLLIGMIAGSEGIGKFEFENYRIAQYMGESALTIILFTGGLDTQWKQIRPILKEGLILSTLGVLITTLVLGTFAWLILGSFSSFDIGTDGITWVEGLLIGAIVSSTDAAAVFSVLKSSKITLTKKLQPLLELESGSNDPMAVLLTIQVIQIILHGDFSFWRLLGNLLLQITLGLLFGFGWGIIMGRTIKHIQLATDGLYPVCSLALLCLTFGVTSYLHGNPFLAIYVAGIVFRHQNISHQDIIVSFHDGLSWLMEITMFLLLGLLVFPSQLWAIAPVSIAIALFLLFIARPISVFICLLPTAYDRAEKLFISWVGLRGAVPIILSLMPVIEGIKDAEQIFNIMFFLVIISLFIQGLSLVPIAKFLGVGKV